MAARFNKPDALTPRGSSLEADDAFHCYTGATGGPRLAKPDLFGGGGIDECDFCSPYDSGLGIQSLESEVVPRFGIAGPIKSRLTEVQSTNSCESVGYGSFHEREDVCADSTLEEQMDRLDVRDGPRDTPTFEASVDPVDEAPVDSRKAFVERLQEYFTPDDDGDTKLHLAVISRNQEAVMYLVMAAASCATSLLDLQNFEFHQTALHLAVVTDQPAIVRLLINSGASCDVRDRQGNTALHVACGRGLVRCIIEMMRQFTVEECQSIQQYCLAAGLQTFQFPPFRLPNLNAMDYEGRSCLHMVDSWKSNPQLASQRIPAVHFLVHNCGANINIQDGKSGHSLLHLSVKHADTELFNYLVQLPSVDLNLTTYSRLTALDMADMLSRHDMMETLRSRAAKHSEDYVPDSSSESDSVDEYDFDDLVVCGQKLMGNSWH